MGDMADVYNETRSAIAALVLDLDEGTLARSVPATPDWTIRDVVAHLAGNAERVNAGDFPREFFESIGSESGIVSLNEWTDRQVTERKGKPLPEILDEWDEASQTVTKMMRADEWPEGVMPFAGHILTADVATHQQDIYGALDIVRDRDSAQVRIATATFIGGLRLRLGFSGSPSLRVVMENKEVTAGGGDPEATVTAPRFELLRALTGRRNPDQIRAFKWDGDPEPFIPHFYPYGVRRDALVE